MIHGEYIKGAYNKKADTTGTDVLYTFLDFYGGQTMPSALEESMLPVIQISDNTNRNATGATTRSAGHIITSAIEQTFSAIINFNNNLRSDKIISKTNETEILDGTSGSLVIGLDYNNIYLLSSNIFNLSSSALAMGINCTISKYLHVGNNISHGNTNDGTIAAKNIYSDGICEAGYFNAYSDRRAKTDIKPITKSVLPLITETQLYSFKYKDLDTPSIGIIAQDIQDVDFDGFSLVDNKEATGQDMDYMSIHESKLIYILGKAIQEQQKEIEDLKKQIKKGL